VIRPAGARELAAAAHDGELFFGFVLDGSMTLDRVGAHRLEACDAFVIPAGETWSLRDASADLALLEVVLPAGAATA
jgi:glyoxylate utilization-related uncharacterized protein